MEDRAGVKHILNEKEHEYDWTYASPLHKFTH
jgi:hypothetical protein